GCGRPELVRAAAGDVPVPVQEVELDRVFKPERLLEQLQAALAKAGERGVIFVDRVELLTGEDALSNYRTQFGAVFRWFLDAAAERSGLAVVMGAASRGAVDRALTSNDLLPRSLSIPPPDLERRRLLFQAALADVPNTDIDYETLAARSAGFSATDILGAPRPRRRLAAPGRRPGGIRGPGPRGGAPPRLGGSRSPRWNPHHPTGPRSGQRDRASPRLCLHGRHPLSWLRPGRRSGGGETA